MLLRQLRQEKRKLVIGRDGRADSPGHSAKFGSYTVMELKKEVIIGVHLVQVSAHRICTQNNISSTPLCVEQRSEGELPHGERGAGKTR